jgi:hypothetical protein
MNKLKLQLIEDGKIVQEVETENTIGQQIVNKAKLGLYIYPHNYINQGQSLTAKSINTGVALSLLNDTYGVSSDGFYCNVWNFGNMPSYYVTNGGQPLPYESDNNNRNTNLIGQNLNLGVSQTYLKDGVHLPGVSNFTSRAITYAWEWGTTQGNGTIKSLATFCNVALGIADDANLSPILSNLLSPLVNLTYTRFIGYKTVGADKLFYYRTYQASPTNNIVVVNETTGASVTTKSLPIPASKDETLNQTSYAVGTLQTVFCNSNFYTFTALTNSQITYKKADETVLTYGNAINVAFTQLGTGTVSITRVTADEQYLYFLAKDTTKLYIIKVDTTTDTVSSIIDLGAYAFRIFNATNPLFNKCPFTGKLFTSPNYLTNTAGVDYIYEIPDSLTPAATIKPIAGNYWGISSYHLNMLTDMYFEKNNRHYARWGTSNSAKANIPTITGTTALVYTSSAAIYEIINRGNFITYAELPTPITKTNSQVLRIQYTLNY